MLVEGQPYAIAMDRSTRGREPAGEVAFSKFDSDKVHNPQEFFEAANELETTFNMAYVDNEHIGFISTGRLPITAAGTNPQLPTLGTGEYDWKGFLSLEQHPHEVDPVSGAPDPTGTTSRHPNGARPRTNTPTARSTACRCSPASKKA